MIASPPATWADAERAFHLAYLADPAPFPRQPVEVSWTTRTSPRGRVSSLILMITDGWRDGRMRWEGVEVTVVAERSGRSMAFPIEGPTPLRPRGTTTGILVGGIGTGAIGCLEVDGQVLWPTACPVERSNG